MKLPKAIYLKRTREKLKPVVIPFIKKLEDKVRVIEMWDKRGLVAKWAVDDNGNTIKGTEQYFKSEVDNQKEMMPRMDRIMRYGNI